MLQHPAKLILSNEVITGSFATSSSVQQVEEYVKLKLKTRKSVKLFLQKEDETPLSSEDSLTTLPHTRIFYQIG